MCTCLTIGNSSDQWFVIGWRPKLMIRPPVEEWRFPFFPSDPPKPKKLWSLDPDRSGIKSTDRLIVNDKPIGYAPNGIIIVELDPIIAHTRAK